MPDLNIGSRVVTGIGGFHQSHQVQEYVQSLSLGKVWSGLAQGLVAFLVVTYLSNEIIRIVLSVDSRAWLLQLR